MTLEQLMALGLSKEHADTVVKIHKDTIDGNYVPKATFEVEREKVKTLNIQVGERDAQIVTLGKFKGTAEELEIKVGELNTANKLAKEKFDADLLVAQKDSAIRFEIMSKVIDPDDVLSKLDYTKISCKDGKIESGLTEQLDALKTTKPHYFKAGDDSPAKSTSSGFQMFGKTPPDSKDSQGKIDEAAEFGKTLAQGSIQSQTVAAKAAETYFK